MADVFKDLKNKLTDFLHKMDTIKKGFQSLPKRFQYIQKGFGEAGNGIGSMFTNLGQSFKLGSLSINKLFEAIGDFLEFNANCFAYFMQNMDTCIIFYLIDFIARIIYLIVPAFVYLLRITTTINIQNQVDDAFRLIRFMDDQFHSFTGVYLARFPDSVRNKCYKCHHGGKVQTINDGVNTIKHRARMVNYTFNETRGTGNDSIPRLMKKMNRSFSKSRDYFAAAFSSSGNLKEDKNVDNLPDQPPPNTDEFNLENSNLDDLENAVNKQMDTAVETEETNVAEPESSTTTQ